MSDVEWSRPGDCQRDEIGDVGLGTSGMTRSECAFTDYVHAARPALLRAARTITGNSEDSEDLLQEGLLRTFAAYVRIEDPRAVGAYVRRTMSNHHISQWRRRRFVEFPCDEVPDGPDLTDPLDPVELRCTLRNALDRLTARERLLLGLRYFAACTDAEIAERLDISVGTVKSSLWRSLRKLREDGALRAVHAELGPGVPAVAALASLAEVTPINAGADAGVRPEAAPVPAVVKAA